MSHYPEFYISLSNTVAERICNLEETATEMCLTNTISRLASLLIKNTNIHSDKLEVINNLPNEELASLLGTTRAVLNRNIQELKDLGAISVGRKHIEVINKKVLKSITSPISIA